MHGPETVREFDVIWPMVCILYRSNIYEIFGGQAHTGASQSRPRWKWIRPVELPFQVNTYQSAKPIGLHTIVVHLVPNS